MKLDFTRFFLFIFSYIISFIIPRNKKIIVFGSRDGKRFADNSRYLFFYLNKNKKFKVIWLTKSERIKKYLKLKKFTVLNSNSLVGLFYGFRAKYHIFDYSEYDTSEFSSIRANKINLGHGVYLKKIIKRVAKPNKLNLIYNKLINKKNIHIYPNKKYAYHILNYFPKDKYKLIVSNFPRNIFLYNKKYLNLGYLTDEEKKIIIKLNKIKGKKIGYFPTWRKKDVDLFLDVKNFSKLEELNNILKKNNSFIIIKHHSNHFVEDLSKTLNSKNISINNVLKKFSNFINLGYDVDLNSIMCNCDLIVSDYSGAIIDYLITEKPIILYTPDILEFKKNPGLFFDYNKFNFSHKTKKYENLLKYLKKYLKNEKKFSKKYATQRKRMKNLFFENNDYFEKITNLLN